MALKFVVIRSFYERGRVSYLKQAVLLIQAPRRLPSRMARHTWGWVFWFVLGSLSGKVPLIDSAARLYR